MIQVTAANNEKMWIRTDEVVLIGPLMDRGVRELGRAVLYIRNLPPLPVKETVDEIAGRVYRGDVYPKEESSGSVEGGSEVSGDSDGSA